MTPRKSPTYSKRLLHSLYIWHRYVGLATALIIILLSITGLMLNHTELLKLDEKRIKSNLILDSYGIGESRPEKSFKTSSHWISQLEGKLFLDGLPLPGRSEQPLTGAIETEQFLVIVSRNSLKLFTPDGEPIETIDAKAGLPQTISKIALGGSESIVIETAEGVFFSDDDLLSWKKADRSDFNWSVATKIPDALAASIAKQVRQDTIPLERFILDLHSGRFFGDFGVLIVDLATLLFLFLAFSGFIIWWRQKKAKRALK